MSIVTVIALAGLGINIAGWLVALGKARAQLNGFGARMKRLEEGLSAETASRNADVDHFDAQTTEINRAIQARNIEVEHRVTLLEAHHNAGGQA